MTGCSHVSNSDVVAERCYPNNGPIYRNMSAIFLPINLLAPNTRIKVMMIAMAPIVLASRTSSLVSCSNMDTAIVFHLSMSTLTLVVMVP